MIAHQRRGFVLALILTFGSSARAGDHAAVVVRATNLLEEIAANPDSGIPPQFLREAKAILIVPDIVENELGVGRKRGHGVFLPREERGEWGNPEPVEVSGLSVGAEAGRVVTDLVMIYRTRKAADKHVEQSLTFSAAIHAFASLHARRKFSGPEADSNPKKEILTYRRRRGLYLGARIGGERMTGDLIAAGASKPPPPPPPADDEKTAADDDKVTVKITKGDPSATNPKPADDSPETGRLKSLLTSMTKTPEAPVAGSGTKDPKVSPASEAKPAPAPAATPR